MSLTRRDFLKFSYAALGSFGLLHHRYLPPWENNVYPLGWGRVTISQIIVYAKPSFDSDRVGHKNRDELLTIFQEFISPEGPEHNPVWYKIHNGYVHSSRIQRVEPQPENEIVQVFPQSGYLAEVTVPYTRSYRLTRTYGWVKLYRLYYGSVHWIKGVDEGPDGKPWYRILDHLLNVEYHVPARHMRVIDSGEYSPIATNVPPEQKRIVVSISTQTFSAYEGESLVYQTRISSGLPSDPDHLEPGDIPTDTPLGSFYIQNKMPSRHMGDGGLTDDIFAYELPGVPWTCLFHETGVGFHGTWWHNNFGRKMSHGCFNMKTPDALWLFRWSNPIFNPEKYFKQERGTLIRVVA